MGHSEVLNTCATVGWARPLKDAAIPQSSFMEPPSEWEGTRFGSQNTGVSVEVQPASGTRV